MPKMRYITVSWKKTFSRIFELFSSALTTSYKKISIFFNSVLRSRCPRRMEHENDFHFSGEGFMKKLIVSAFFAAMIVGSAGCTTSDSRCWNPFRRTTAFYPAVTVPCVDECCPPTCPTPMCPTSTCGSCSSFASPGFTTGVGEPGPF